MLCVCTISLYYDLLVYHILANITNNIAKVKIPICLDSRIYASMQESLHDRINFARIILKLSAHLCDYYKGTIWNKLHVILIKTRCTGGLQLSGSVKRQIAQGGGYLRVQS